VAQYSYFVPQYSYFVARNNKCVLAADFYLQVWAIYAPVLKRLLS